MGKKNIKTIDMKKDNGKSIFGNFIEILTGMDEKDLKTSNEIWENWLENGQETEKTVQERLKKEKENLKKDPLSYVFSSLVAIKKELATKSVHLNSAMKRGECLYRELIDLKNRLNSLTVSSISVKMLNPEAKAPVRAHKNDAGMDLYTTETVTLGPNEGQVVKTGIAVEIPEGFVGKIEDRSSMGKNGIRTMGGVVDSGYTGEVGVILWNVSKKVHQIMAGDKIAQMLIYKVETPSISIYADLFPSDSERGDGGFGSTGK